MDQDETQVTGEGTFDREKENEAPGNLEEGEEVTTSDHQYGRVDSVNEAAPGTDEKTIAVEILDGFDKGNMWTIPKTIWLGPLNYIFSGTGIPKA